MTFRYLILGATALSLVACSNNADKAAETPAETTAEAVVETVEAPAEETAEAANNAPSLDAILDAQPDNVKARYDARRPKETLEYFGIEPGMTVAEVLPGGGWYSKILLPYLGDEGHLIGIDYSVDMWSKFGGFANEEFLERRKSWASTWTEQAAGWDTGSEAEISAFAFGSMPQDMKGKADAVLMFRALHHLNRFEGAYWDGAIADIKNVLKPGGVVGIVQHRAPEDSTDEWANGDRGYIKQSFVIAAFEEAGFELVGEPNELNANPKDEPGADDQVWRLPPTLGTSREDPELRAKMEAIGESDRMTLLFRLK